VPEPRFEIPANYAEALELAARKVREVEALEQRNAELEPAAEAWDVLASAEGDYSVGDAAKMLSRDPMITTGQNRLFQYMRDLGWIYRRGEAWRAYQTQVDNGRLVERASEPYRHPTTGEWTLPPPQVRITAKGLMALRRELTGMTQLPISS
jgi:phage antirepressor YoqD-like protein